jgi:hypothetical protein
MGGQHLAGVSVRRLEDITQTLWGTRASAGLVSKLNKQIYEKIELWRTRKLEGRFPCVYLDGIVLKRTWAEEVRNVSILVAFGVNEDGFREIRGAAEGAKEDKDGWSAFVKDLKARGLEGVRLFVSDKCMELLESLAEYYPEALWQRCTVEPLKNRRFRESGFIRQLPSFSIWPAYGISKTVRPCLSLHGHGDSLEVVDSCGQEPLNRHVLDPPSNGTPQTMKALALGMNLFHPPLVTQVQSV